ncbi:heme lyase CcmF/NrfE family subunit [Hydrogenophaga sp. IBVHS2]|uniref:heme lyase CcmF/NrfE family subunit n=1 Tax=Hydrogenophaga sp. IBVHS2 TaxID=1985170 RepID=UPI000A2D44CB|nr:heme lyase CcmF/NrfE family subunit [Hydrogenophaga sp. IBVHS2]OSZ67701.1 c-type cytochrome biogenesis protein CcmF [Hydrogenophaga sp. IBVHS2]
MIPEIGHFALVLALVMALVQSVLPLWGAQTGHSGWMRLATPAATAQCLLLLVAYACLTQAFVASDFSVKLAAQHSHTALPLIYRITAVWGNHEGSILLWSLVLSLWTFAVAHRSAALDLPMRARVLGVMGLISVGFLLFTLFTSNPFLRLDVPPLDGQDLNPLLQDPGMAIHPPMLYMGYVGFVVAFAFAVAALLAGRLDAAWAHWSRPWTLLAWMFLTIGIALGSFWAYYELGWGGWWFWDPVENASFMPWLVGTALIHSLSVSEKRGAFRRWTVLLAILAFSLSLLGTFIVRSGVLSSVHAFATDPARGVFILAFLAVVVGGSLALFAWRAPAIGAGDRFEPVSRESFLLANNVLLLSAAAAVLLGTLYPLIIDALGQGKLSVGPPYFQAVFVPLMAPALFLMGLGPLARWRSAQLPDLALRLRAAAAVAMAGALLAALLLGVWTPMSALGLLMSAWVAASTLAGAWQRLHDHPGPGWRARLAAQSGAWWGLQLAHLGVAVFVAGVTVVSSLSTESDVRMEPGQTVEAGGHRFTLRSVELVQGPNYTAGRATIDVVRDGQAVATLRPERRIYTVSRMPMTEVAIDRGVLRDLYVALGEPVSATAWSVRLHHKPLVNWIWGGCLLMALGGLLAAADRRYRTVRLARTAGAAGVPARPAAPGQKGFA